MGLGSKKVGFKHEPEKAMPTCITRSNKCNSLNYIHIHTRQIFFTELRTLCKQLSLVNGMLLIHRSK